MIGGPDFDRIFIILKIGHFYFKVQRIRTKPPNLENITDEKKIEKKKDQYQKEKDAFL